MLLCAWGMLMTSPSHLAAQQTDSSCFVPLCPEVSIAAFSWAVCQSCHSLVANTKTLAHCMNTWDWIMLTQREKSNNSLHSAQTKFNIYSSWSLTKYLLDANFWGDKCASRFYIWVWHFHTKTFLYASGPVNQSLYALCFRVVRPFFSCERDILGTPCGNFFKLPLGLKDDSSLSEDCIFLTGNYSYMNNVL